MKILCLHGYGTSPDVMRFQMSSLVKEADPIWEFYYVCGEETCLPAPGIGDTFPGPYFCFSRLFNTDSESAAHSLIDDTIAEHGPFDGAFGFSQGAAILVAYLIEHKMSCPNDPSPFRFVTLCSPTPPLARNTDYCQFLFGSLSPQDEARIRSCQEEEFAHLPGQARAATTTLVGVLDAVQSIIRKPRNFYFDRPMSELPSLLHPELCKIRLSIPTVHVRGKNELSAVRSCGALVEGFFEPTKQRLVEHTAGHEIPRLGSEVRQILLAMEWAIGQSQLSIC